MVGGDSLVAHPRGCRPRSGMYAGIPGRRLHPSLDADPPRRASESGRGQAGRIRTAQWRCVVASPGRSIPDSPGSYQFLDAAGRVLYVGKAKSLRSRLSNYFADPDTLLPRTAQMVARGRPRRVDPGGQRGGGHPPRVRPHQAAPPPLQHPPGRRQVVPVVGGDPGRRVAPGGGGAGTAPPRGALLRPLRARGGHPRHARPAAAHLPGAHVLGPQARSPHQAGQALSVVPHRAVLGPVHRGRGPRPLRRHGGRPHGLSGRRHRRGRAPSQGRDGGGRRRPRLRARRPPARRARAPCSWPASASRW